MQLNSTDGGSTPTTDEVTAPQLTPASRHQLTLLLADLGEYPEMEVDFFLAGWGRFSPSKDDWIGSTVIATGPAAGPSITRTIVRMPKHGFKSPEARSMLAQVRRAWSNFATPEAVQTSRLTYERRLTEQRQHARQVSDNATRMIAQFMLNTYQQASGTRPTRLTTLTPTEQRPWFRLAQTMALATTLHDLFARVMPSPSEDGVIDQPGANG